MTNFKTPLRYPGGKSRAVSKLKSFLPSLSSYDQYLSLIHISEPTRPY